MARPKKDTSAQPAASDVKIIPSIKIEGNKNALETLFQGDPSKLPVMISVGLAEVPGTNTYMAYTMKSKGSQILSIEVEEPNLRLIAEESAKLFFVNNFMSGEVDATV